MIQYISYSILALRNELKKNYKGFELKEPDMHHMGENNMLILYTMWERYCEILTMLLHPSTACSTKDKLDFVKNATSHIKMQCYF